MAVTLTVAKLMANTGVDDIDDATELVTERLAYVTEAVTHNVPVAPDVVHNEAAIRLAGYLYDSPRAPSGTRYANAMRNSGAASILFPYRVHSAGLANAVADAADAGIGTTGNPVTEVDVVAGELVITFADGTTESHTLPAGGGDGTDQTARDSAATNATAIATNTAAITALDTRLQPNDIQPGDGIAVDVIDDPTNGPGRADSQYYGSGRACRVIGNVEFQH